MKTTGQAESSSGSGRVPWSRASSSRRAFLWEASLGFGTLALADLLKHDGLLAAPAAAGGHDLRPRHAHFAPQATNVIMLMQNGGPSQMDLFDQKPELQKRGEQKHPEQVESFQPGSEGNKLMASPFAFGRHGESGLTFSELLPQLASVADELCMVRSMFSENNNHPQGIRMINTGKTFLGRPTLGAWVCYALGTENQNLPAYVALRDPDGYNSGGTTLWTNGWLPAMFRGTEIQSRGAPVLNLKPGSPLAPGVQPTNLEFLAKFNEERRRLYPDNSELEARIRHYELAARMQLAAEKLLELSGETESTAKAYGLDHPATADYGKRCLMARRLVESGVRYVQILAPVKPSFMPWDNHSNLPTDIRKIATTVDRPTATLIEDLKTRGLLDSTIVLWAGEFGRLPISQHGNGRDHNRFAFTVLLAGGGFKQGHAHGATDEFGYKSVEDRVSCPDLLATILHQLGLDHERLTFRHNGRDETLTDSVVSNARVVSEILKQPRRVA